MKTLREQYVKTLKARNWKQVETKSSKYIVYHGLINGFERYLFIGKSGALRINKENKATTSVVASDKFKKLLLSESNSY
jgi:hypothetical protein